MSATQKSRYPRFLSKSQSANSLQKANRPSSKRKTSSSLSYTNSESPMLMRYVTTSHRSSGRRLIATPGRYLAALLSLWSIAPRVDMELTLLGFRHPTYALWRGQKYAECAYWAAISQKR